jgi:hypothetical protein
MKLWPWKYTYDAFVIHAVEDRSAITSELCARLKDAKIKIWYSGDYLTVGCNLHEEIMEALPKSRYGIIILSENSIHSEWLAKELYELLPRATNRRQKVILPVFHGITIDELKKKIIVPDNIWSTSSADGVEKAANVLISAIKSCPTNARDWIWENRYALRLWLLLSSCSAIALLCVLYFVSLRPSKSFVKAEIYARVETLQENVEYEHESNRRSAHAASINEIKSAHEDFVNFNSYYRNDYEFTNHERVIRSRAGVELALGLDPANLTPRNTYGMTDPDLLTKVLNNSGKTDRVNYFLLNTLPVEYTIVSSELINEGRYEVNVSFRENIRYIAVNLLYPNAREVPKKHQVSMIGFLPNELYVFEKKGKDWVLKAIQ